MTSLGAHSHTGQISNIDLCVWQGEAALGAMKNLHRLLGWGRTVILEHSEAVATGSWKVIGRPLSCKCSAPSAAIWYAIGFISTRSILPSQLFPRFWHCQRRAICDIIIKFVISSPHAQFSAQFSPHKKHVNCDKKHFAWQNSIKRKKWFFTKSA